jgi:hypothetical protein
MSIYVYISICQTLSFDRLSQLRATVPLIYLSINDNKLTANLPPNLKKQENPTPGQGNPILSVGSFLGPFHYGVVMDAPPPRSTPLNQPSGKLIMPLQGYQQECGLA